MARAIKLIDAPIGLFEVDGILVLKTEYSTRHEDGTITPDCYIIESGEYFWGGVDSVEERNNLEVAPVDMPTLTPPNEWVNVEDELPKLPDCDKCSMMVNTARKGNPKSFPMIYERAIVRGKRVERWKYYWDRIADEPPDYWMYLPEPPTKET